jgi:serine/threonine-protein kinase
LFFDVAAESIDNARGLFDKNKRAEIRARLRRGSRGDAKLPASTAAVPPPVLVAPMPPSAPVSPPIAPAVPIPTTPPDEGSALVPPEVLSSRYGAIVRRAAGDSAAVRQEVGRLGAADRALLPDVGGVVEALVKRIASLATALHRLDGDLAPDALPELDKQIAGAEAEPGGTPDRERKLGLLRRQRATLQDLADRRAMLSAQLENAGIVLRNIRLDLVRLRSAGVQSAIDDVATATQEARALSREIAHVLNAAEELKSV